MKPEDADAAVTAAETRLRNLRAETTSAQEALFDAYADAVRYAGRTPDELARSGTFGATYIRKQVRARGVEPRKGGPKPQRKDGA
ncbi:hypothetical protein [Actinomadura sp. WMMA1423]|uniref:hypothetical protein n=1 Tax=Actinomadura sp. WMMA1423 TaxID=2591108 RepID=UPI0011463B05|nr:hypothetical protein [Actinomadura sp. WMMA1423]